MPEPEKPCFIIMPVSTPDDIGKKYEDEDHFKHVLDQLFVPAAKKAGFTPIPPTVKGSKMIHAEIVKNLATADMVLCDMTALNANVFFELGIRTSLDKPACHVRDEHFPEVAFDVSGVNYYPYDGKMTTWGIDGAIDKLAEHIGEVKKGSEGRNEMWKVLGIESKASEPATSDSPSEAKLDLILRHLDEIIPALLRGTRDQKRQTKQSNAVLIVHRIGLPAKAELDILGKVGVLPEVAVVELHEMDEVVGFSVRFSDALGPTARTRFRRSVEMVLDDIGVPPKLFSWK